MKNVTRSARPALLSAAMFLAACSSSSPSVTAPAPTATVTPATMTGNWVVASLVQRTEDKTSQFSGYTLTFTSTSADNGTVVATRNGSSVSGIWSHSPAVTYYGSSSKESIVLNLGISTPFDRLTHTWNVVSTTASTLSLASPEVLEDTHLMLTKR